MLTNEEKDRIIERAQFENRIREELATKHKDVQKSKRWAWLESKLGLLVVGALVSGVLVPLFQFSQETIKWARQNHFENLKYHMELVREGMEELTIANAYVAEAYEIVSSLIDEETID